MDNLKGNAAPMTHAPAAAPSLLDRLRTLGSLWRDIGGAWRDETIPAVHPDLPAEDADSLRRQMRACLDGRGGEVSARARAAALGRAYLGLNAEGRARFLSLLASEFGPDRQAVDLAMGRLADAAEPVARAAAERELREVLEPPRLRLLTQFNVLPEGVKFLVDMRAELLGLLRDDGTVAGLERDLKGLLASWFDIGFLELRRLTWRSPASVLEKIMAYEAVHAIRGWEDLKNRLDSDRRLYAFFHPRMPDEPLIFVEVALVRGMSGNIQELLDESAPLGDPATADTAIFYSINNAQRGLAGISFGNFLIKRVVDNLAQEFPKLKTYATLSPVPGFRRWLDECLAEEEAGLLTPAEDRQLSSLPSNAGAKPSLRALLDGEWWRDGELADALRGPLLRLCARFLVEERRADGRARDPVAHFHFSNGARMERLNWLADISPKGMRESCGMMINYLYRLSEIEANHEAYTGLGKVTASAAIRGLVKG